MKRLLRGSYFYIILLVLLIAFVVYQGRNIPKVEEKRLDQFVADIQERKIEKLTLRGPYVDGVLKGSKTEFSVYLPEEMRVTFYPDYLKELVENKEIKLGAEPPPQRPWYMDIIPYLITFVLLGGIWFVFMNRSQGGNAGVMNFGKSKARLNREDGPRITFNDVAGLKEEKEELYEIVDFLKNPKKYIALGARIPKGVLMVGPPGTGKTYLTKAVAGEADVPFFSISGSDFVEMFVGVGASRVRDLFQQAKRNSPCIVFIDEIDAVGRRRGAGLGGGHDEREQTLNQLLVEMDGFGTNEGIIIIAATNRPDILDPAILRPGRFDRQVFVGLPDLKAREEILGVHVRNKKLAADVSLAAIAKRTTGFTPADLENLTNEAALLAARQNQTAITAEIFEEAAIKVVAGPEKKSRVVIEKERVLTAYHESGHAVTSTLLPDMDPVHMITIVPRGRAGGFTAYIPEEDRSYMTKTEMENELISLLGGRAAEAVMLDDISTGASNDIERATQLARSMVTKYGMSERLGTLTYGSDEGEVFLGKELGHTRTYSEEVAGLIDEEIKKIVDHAYDTAIKLLSDHKQILHGLAKALLEKETLREEEYTALFHELKGKTDVEPPVEYFRAVKKSGGVNAYEAIQQAKEAQISSERREDFRSTAE